MNKKVKTFFIKLTNFVYKILILLLIFYFGFIIFRQIHNNYETNLQINQLEKDIQDLEAENQNLANLLIYYQSHTYRKMEARRRLGLKEPGEKVVILPENKDVSVIEENQSINNQTKEKNNSSINYLKWYQMIFGKRELLSLP